MKTLEPPEIKPIIKLDKHAKLLAKTETEAQVVVHGTYIFNGANDMIRIWKSTFLCPHGSTRRSQMIQAYNIALYPNWTNEIDLPFHYFTLIFKSLPKNCTIFDLIEDIPECGGFKIKNIYRNNSDVYHLVFD